MYLYWTISAHAFTKKHEEDSLVFNGFYFNNLVKKTHIGGGGGGLGQYSNKIILIWYDDEDDLEEKVSVGQKMFR